MTKSNNENNVKTNHKKKIVRVILLITLLGGAAAWWFFLRKPSDAKEIIAVSGRIESDDAVVAAKTSGRIREISVREGDHVKAGQVVAVLDDEQLNARVQQELSNVERSEAKLRFSRQQIAVLQAQLEQSRLGVSQARVDAEGRVSQAQTHVASAKASLAKTDAITNVGHSCQQQEHSLESQAETCMGNGAIAAKIGIPPVACWIHALLFDA